MNQFSFVLSKHTEKIQMQCDAQTHLHELLQLLNQRRHFEAKQLMRSRLSTFRCRPVVTITDPKRRDTYKYASSMSRYRRILIKNEIRLQMKRELGLDDSDSDTDSDDDNDDIDPWTPDEMKIIMEEVKKKVAQIRIKSSRCT